MNVHWQDPLLPAILDRNETPNPLPGSSKVSKTSSILVIAVLNAHIPAFDSFLNICLIIAVLSASNTALYVASRTLFGLTREISPNGKGWWRKFSKLSTTSFKTKVPVFALLISAVTFCWVPFLHLRLSYSLNDVRSSFPNGAGLYLQMIPLASKYHEWHGNCCCRYSVGCALLDIH